MKKKYIKIVLLIILMLVPAFMCGDDYETNDGGVYIENDCSDCNYELQNSGGQK